jgi:hypothetical protein
VTRELALIKVHAPSASRAEIKQLVDIFRAQSSTSHNESMTVEITGTEDKVDSLLEILRPFGIKNHTRTGRICMVARRFAHQRDTLAARPEPGDRPVGAASRRPAEDHQSLDGGVWHGHDLLREGRGSLATQGQENRHYRVRQPGARPRAQPQGQRL